MRAKLSKLATFFAMARRVSPGYFALLLLNAAASGGQIMANVLLPRYLIDELTRACDPRRLLVLAGAIVASNLFFAFFQKLATRLLAVSQRDMNARMLRLMSQKIASVPYAYLENPRYLDLKERAVFAISNQSALENLISSLAGLVKSAVTLAGLVAVLFTLSPLFVLLLCAVIGVELLIQSRFSRYQVAFYEGLIPINRRFGYYFNLALRGEMQKDFRIYGMNRLLSGRIAQFCGRIMDEFDPFYKRMGLNMGVYQVLTDLQAALAYGYAGLRCVTDALGPRIGVGQLTMYVSATIGFTSTVSELGQQSVVFTQMLSYLDPFLEFMRLPDEEETSGRHPMPDKVESIAFEHVTFRYPGSDTDVLKDVSFTVRGGEKISVVGLNGAGKTTLVKLLCRLYAPDSGRILLNGTDIAAFDHAAYLSRIAAVFQDYKLFAFSVEENVTCRPLGDDEAGSAALLDRVGLAEKLAALPDGQRSLYGKAYDENGVAFSGGEGQKIAIARALYKDAPLILLDEPTSALDPLAEAEVYEKFHALTGERTAFYISHRMSSSVFCDRILLLEDGRVAGFDTHERLMRDESCLYAQLFNTQAVNYRA